MRCRRLLRRLIVILGFAAGINLLVPGGDAQGFTTVRPGGRGGSWEFFLPVTYIASSTVSGQGGSSANLNSDIGFGFGLGYNINDRFSISGAFTWSNQSYDATIVSAGTGTSSHRVGAIDSATFSVNATYYISDKDVTPFLAAGLGVTTVDTNVPSGSSPIYSCWWDPYWGYVCGYYTPTKMSNDLSYNVGIGVRWDASTAFGLRAGYYKWWIDYENAAGGMPDIALWKLELLFRM